jgi:glycosyltransferase involved in cell wall biosynthesis
MNGGHPGHHGTLPVSVVIPAYNRAEMIVRAVRSALEQRPHPPSEVIVVDDCSVDGTGEAAAAAGATVVRHDVNQGEGAARNTGVAAAREPWVALLDSDDEWLPYLLSMLWPLRADHVLVGGGSLNCGPDPAQDRYAGPLTRHPLVVRTPRSLIYPENFVAASGTMARRSILTAVGGYSSELKGGADMDLWIRVLERGTGVIVPFPVVLYHMHAGQVTTDVRMMSRAHRIVAERYQGRPWWSSGLLRRWEGATAYDAARGAWAEGRRADAGLQIASLMRSPTRALGAAGIILRRARLRRRSGLVDRRGVPTVALLPGTSSSSDHARDLRDVSMTRALAQLAWRPTHVVEAPSRAVGLAARALGAREVSYAEQKAPGG